MILLQRIKTINLIFLTTSSGLLSVQCSISFMKRAVSFMCYFILTAHSKKHKFIFLNTGSTQAHIKEI
jgi:hypothetical protein